MTYSVLMEPVIPVLWPDGTSSAIGIREAFLRAHEIRDIQGETPLERYALLRLLIAFAMDMLHPRTSYDRRNLLDEGRFDQAVFDQYVSMCEQDSPRFDLFDPEHPFMQSKYDETLDAKAEKPAAILFPTLPTGNNHIFIDHRLENSHVFSPDRALGALCVIYLFCFSGAQEYPSSVNNTPPIYITILGNNLFETIITNMLSISEAGRIDYGEGKVPWRTECIVIPKKKFASIALLEAYTWMPRRITLRCDSDGLIRTVYYQQGHNFLPDGLWKDPHVPYNQTKGEYTPVRPKLGRQLWRDVGSLVYSEHNDNSPFILFRLRKIKKDKLAPFIHVKMLGFVLDQGKYDIWYEDTLSLPNEVLENQSSAFILKTDVDMIEEMSKALYSCVNKFVDLPRSKSKPRPYYEIATQCQQHFLHSAHELLFGSVMDKICGNIPNKEHAEYFCENVKCLLQETTSQVLRVTGTDSKAMMQQIEAEKQIWKSWGKLTKERMKVYVGS